MNEETLPIVRDIIWEAIYSLDEGVDKESIIEALKGALRLLDDPEVGDFEVGDAALRSSRRAPGHGGPA